MLSHINEDNEAGMVDVGDKPITQRTARAQSVVVVPDAVADLFRDGDITSPKGPVFHTARIAGIMGAKRTSELIPLCHPIGLDDCSIDIELADANRILITCRVAVAHRTGVEMEALTGASIAALTVYDMCKAVSREMVICETRLLEKTGGRSGDWVADA